MLSHLLTVLRFGVSQGSLLGPLLFTVYTAPLQIPMETHCIQYHRSADDLQVYITYFPYLPDDRERAVKQLTDLISMTWHSIVIEIVSRKLNLNGIKAVCLSSEPSPTKEVW